MLVSLACLVIIGIGIYCVVYGIIYYREITKDDREYAKELKEAKKRRKLEAEEKAQKLKESKIEKKKLSEIKTGKPWLRFRLLIAFPCILILWIIYFLLKGIIFS